MEIHIKNSLSHNRIGTYENLKGLNGHGQNLPIGLSKALELYAWNAQTSSAFLVPLHICEVVIRNAIAEALEAVYGNNWPWSTGFERSLPNSGRFSMEQELHSARRTAQSPGQAIPEFKFAFWRDMFTAKFDRRIWNAHLRAVFPNMPQNLSVQDARKQLYDHMEAIRKLRNRIAHHEPIFARNLRKDLDIIRETISWRCQSTAVWVELHESVTDLLATRPL